MTLELALSSELEERLRREAQKQGLTPGAVTVRLLDEHLPPADKRLAAMAMLQQWIAEDKALTDQDIADNAAALRAIDADRLSDRKLFADILKDESS